MTKEKKFEQLDSRNMVRLFQFAMLGIGAELQTMQDIIVRTERFGNMAVDYPTHFNPSNGRVRDLDDTKKRHDDLFAFSQQLQIMLDHVKDVDFTKSFS